jgi:hypothetical protein
MSGISVLHSVSFGLDFGIHFGLHDLPERSQKLRNSASLTYSIIWFIILNMREFFCPKNDPSLQKILNNSGFDCEKQRYMGKFVQEEM